MEIYGKACMTFSLQICAVNKQDHIAESENQVAIITYQYIQNIFYVDIREELSEKNYFIYFMCHLLGVLSEGPSGVCVDAEHVPRVMCSCWWHFAGGPRTSCCTSWNNLLLFKDRSSILHVYQKRIILHKMIFGRVYLKCPLTMKHAFCFQNYKKWMGIWSYFHNCFFFFPTTV